MRIEIEIPKEFEEHFNQDKFKDSFERITADIKHSLENGNCLCAGRYEHEIIEMLEKAFENSKPAYDIDKAVEKLKELEGIQFDGENESYQLNWCIETNRAIEIVKQGGVADEVCEYKIKDEVIYASCNNKSIASAFCWFNECGDYKYCPYCGKKIKAVE